MKVLFIGGTGIISTAVSHLAIERGFELSVLNRGKRNDVLPAGVEVLQGNWKDDDDVKALLQGRRFDAIVQWISFTVDDVARDVRLLSPHTPQLVFISSASAYQKPLPFLPVTEAMPLDNPYWPYSKNKQRCEEYLLANQTDDFHVTIVRPSHTYDDRMIVSQLNSHAHPYSLLWRMKQGLPIILPDGGEEWWTLTYNADFAAGFLDLLGNPATYGEYYHLTSDKTYRWKEIHQALADALGVHPPVVSIPWDTIFEVFPDYRPEILGDKAKSLVFDNKKVRAVAPHYTSRTEYPDIARQIVAYYENNPSKQTLDHEFLSRYDRLVASVSDA
jgi:nucleoside-diphosphate-sugar epimerase